MDLGANLGKENSKFNLLHHSLLAGTNSITPKILVCSQYIHYFSIVATKSWQILYLYQSHSTTI
jgi:hypothetical protein